MTDADSPAPNVPVEPAHVGRLVELPTVSEGAFGKILAVEGDLATVSVLWAKNKRYHEPLQIPISELGNLIYRAEGKYYRVRQSESWNTWEVTLYDGQTSVGSVYCADMPELIAAQVDAGIKGYRYER